MLKLKTIKRYSANIKSALLDQHRQASSSFRALSAVLNVKIIHNIQSPKSIDLYSTQPPFAPLPMIAAA